MSIEGGQSKIDIMQRKMQRLRAELCDEMQRVMKDLFEGFFQDYPEVKTVSWNQYTPYFNDGDACYFSYNSLMWHPCSLEINGKVLEQDEPSGSYGGHSWWKTDKGKAAIKELKKLDRFLEGLEDELEATFGDHSTITASATGFDVTEYEHE